MGLAIGRARAASAASPRLAVAAVWWFLAWMAYQLLQFVAMRFKIVVPTQIEAAIWIPPLTVLAIAAMATFVSAYRHASRRASRARSADGQH